MLLIGLIHIFLSLSYTRPARQTAVLWSGLATSGLVTSEGGGSPPLIFRGCGGSLALDHRTKPRRCGRLHTVIFGTKESARAEGPAPGPVIPRDLRTGQQDGRQRHGVKTRCHPPCFWPGATTLIDQSQTSTSFASQRSDDPGTRYVRRTCCAGSFDRSKCRLERRVVCGLW